MMNDAVRLRRSSSSRKVLPLSCFYATFERDCPAIQGEVAKALQSRWGHQSFCMPVKMFMRDAR
jgi:hypothetical protein